MTCTNRYKNIYNLKNINLMILFCWVFSFGLLCLPLFQIWGQFGLDLKTFSCTILKKNNKSPKKFLFLFAFCIPILTITLSYSIIWIKVKSGSSKNSTIKKIASNRDLRLTKMILIIFSSFVICFAPLMIANVLINQER